MTNKTSQQVPTIGTADQVGIAPVTNGFRVFVHSGLPNEIYKHEYVASGLSELHDVLDEIYGAYIIPDMQRMGP